MVIIAYKGKRCVCRCIESMGVVIGKEERELFTMGHVYDCVIRDDDQLLKYYKIYGDEFDLSCTETEFLEHFMLINKKTGVKR